MAGRGIDMEQKATNVVWHESVVNREQRQALLGQTGVLLWFTGLSGSGKSTVANAVARKLHEQGRLTYLLDGDNVRYGLNKDLGFSIADRQENLRRIGEVAKLMVDAGLITLASFISPLAEDRQKVRHLLGEDFIEIYVDCALSVCEQRDPKNLYKKARAGEIPEFTGISSPYEPPTRSEIQLHTDEQTIEEAADQVLGYLIQRGLLRGN